MGIKAIETVYNNHRFRSRLEARWAVFFDHAKIKYEYEPEGYDLGEYGKYLPDFFIKGDEKTENCYPGWGYFVEIKAIIPNRKYLLKLAKLSELTKHTVKIFVGPPWEFKYKVLHHSNWNLYINDKFRGSSGGLGYNYGPNGKLSIWENFALSCFHSQVGAEGDTFSVDAAVIKSKKARFEHGECG